MKGIPRIGQFDSSLKILVKNNEWVYDATQMNYQSRSVSKYVKRIGMRDFNEVNKFRQGKKTVQ